MRKNLVFFALAFILALAIPVGAAEINGSAVLFSIDALIDGSNFLDSTTFTPYRGVGDQGVLTGGTDGDYDLMGSFIPGDGGVIDLNDLTTYTLDFAGFGSFSANVGSILSRTSNVLAVLYIGTFTPGPGGPFVGNNLDPTPTSVRVSLTLTGLISYSGTMASPPEELVPEPGTYALMAGGLFSLFALRRKRA